MKTQTAMQLAVRLAATGFPIMSTTESTLGEDGDICITNEVGVQVPLPGASYGAVVYRTHADHIEFYEAEHETYPELVLNLRNALAMQSSMDGIFVVSEADIQRLAKQASISVSDILQQDRTGRYRIALELWGPCEPSARRTLLNDPDPSVRTAAWQHAATIAVS